MSGAFARPFILYGRPGCHLCHAAALALQEAGLSFTPPSGGGAWVREESVEGRPELEAVFGWDIPVLISPEGAVLLKGVFSPERVKKALRMTIAFRD